MSTPTSNPHFLGLPRCGSTLVRNLMSASGLHFTMVHSDGTIPDFIVVRDVRDAVISYALALKYPLTTSAQVDQFLFEDGAFITRCFYSAKAWLRDKPDIELLRYEEFFLDHTPIYDLIERKYRVKIPDRPDLSEQFGTANMLKVQRRFRRFSEWDPLTLIHGNHINGGEIGRWKSLDPAVSGRLCHRLSLLHI